MGRFMKGIRQVWLGMLEPPWRHGREIRDIRWSIWLIGWAWSLSGLLLGALIAPSLVRFAGLASTTYQDWLVIGIAVLAGFLVQLLGWCLFLPAVSWMANAAENDSNWLFAGAAFALAAVALPIVGVVYGISRYLTWIGAGQRSVTIAFVGGLLIKTFAIPLIKGIATGALFKWFMSWLRGGKETEKAD